MNQIMEENFTGISNIKNPILLLKIGQELISRMFAESNSKTIEMDLLIKKIGSLDYKTDLMQSVDSFFNKVVEDNHNRICARLLEPEREEIQMLDFDQLQTKLNQQMFFDFFALFKRMLSKMKEISQASKKEKNTMTDLKAKDIEINKNEFSQLNRFYNIKINDETQKTLFNESIMNNLKSEFRKIWN